MAEEKNELKLGPMSITDLAKWFGKSRATVAHNKIAYLNRLENYCEFEELPSGKINITTIKDPEFKKEGNRQLIKDNFITEWNDNGLDTVKGVTEKIVENHFNELTIADSTAYNYALQARNELYNKPFCGRGEKGCCEYVWCVELGDGQYRELNEAEKKEKNKLLTKYFGNATEKQLLVKAMVQAGEITSEEAFDVLNEMTGMNDINFFSFLKELSKTLGCKVKKVTKLINSAW